MTGIYKLKTHIFLDKDIYHKPFVSNFKPGLVWEAEGNMVLQYMKDEAFINGYQHPVLKLTFGVDIDGRNCSYNPFLDYSYTYNMYQIHDRILVYVSEKTLKKGQFKKKGPNDIFGAVKSNRTASRCKAIDYFTNGTYLISCPVLEKKLTVTIQATYISIATSNYPCNTSINNPIWSLKNFSVQMDSDFDVTISGRSTCTSSRGHERGFWLKVGALFHWATKDCYYPYHFDNRQLTCLSSKSIIMPGDSHTRNRYFALKNNYGLKQLVFHHAMNGQNLLANLLDIYKNCMNGKCIDVLVPSVGHHDLREYDVIAYIAGMSDIFSIFKHFAKLSKPPQIIWIETMPVHDNGYHGHMMTNQVVEAVNDWVNHQMRQLSLDIVYTYEQSIAMTSQHVGDGDHYDNFVGPNIKTKRVNVGGAVISALVNVIYPLK